MGIEMLRVALCDDEASARDALRILLEKILMEGSEEIVYEFSSGANAVSWLKKHPGVDSDKTFRQSFFHIFQFIIKRVFAFRKNTREKSTCSFWMWKWKDKAAWKPPR